jgi:hypothetical protein
MFASAQQVIDVPPSAAQVRLTRLLNGGWLGQTSDEIYQRSTDDLMRVGPFGDRAGPSRLVRVRFTDPAYRDDEVRIGLRWEAIGVTGGLFPALDADITMNTDGERTRIKLTGTYRPPLGALGTGLDRLVLGKVAAATFAAFLDQVTSALVVDGPGGPAAGDDRVAVDGDAPR